MPSISSREIIELLKEDGWEVVNVEGSHWQFKHPTKKGRVTVVHPTKHIAAGTLSSMRRQSGLKRLGRPS